VLDPSQLAQLNNKINEQEKIFEENA